MTLDIDTLTQFMKARNVTLSPTNQVPNIEHDLHPNSTKWETKISTSNGKKWAWLYTWSGMLGSVDTADALNMILDDTDGLPTYTWNYKRFMEESGDEYIKMGLSRLTVYQWYIEQYKNMKALKTILGETAMIELLELKNREDN